MVLPLNLHRVSDIVAEIITARSPIQMEKVKKDCFPLEIKKLEIGHRKYLPSKELKIIYQKQRTCQ